MRNTNDVAAFVFGVLLAVFVAIHPFAVRSEIVPGTIQGTPSVSLNGSSAYNLPIAVPSGTAGMAPQLFLTYDSNAGPSQFGLGWSLAGVSAISRINRTYFVDGKPSPIRFDDNVDAFSLDGARLVRAPEGGRFLAKSIDDQTRVWRNGAGFIAKTKAGLTLYFGESQNSRIQTSGGKILTWALSRVEDTFGNQIVFLYVQRDGDYGVDRIFWTLKKSALNSASLYDEDALQSATFASVKVQYAQNGDPYSLSFAGGERTRRNLLATGITSYVGDSEFRRYEFEYQRTMRFGDKVLKSIREIGADIGGQRIEYPKTSFTYTAFEPRWNEAKDYALPSDFGSYRSLRSGYRLVDLDGDNDRDLLYSAYVGGHRYGRAFRQDADSWVPIETLTPPIDFSNDNDELNPIFFFDSDGDGMQELYSSRIADGQTLATAHIQENDTWREMPARAPPFALVEDANVLRRIFATSWAAKPRLLTWSNEGLFSSWEIDQDTWQNEPVKGWTDQEMPASVIEGDFNCDGSTDLATLSANRLSLRFFSKAIEADDALAIEDIGTFNSNSEISDIKLISQGSCHIAAVKKSDAAGIFIVSIDADNQIDAQELSLSSSQLERILDIYPLDLDGQGVDSVALLFTPEPNAANISVFKNEPATNTWVQLPTFDYFTTSGEEVVDESYLVAVEDIDDDGRQDFLLLPTETGITTKALINTDTGFDLAFDFIPPIEFAREEKVGASPQFVDLNADGLIDLAGFHLDKDGKEVVNTAQINTRNGWISVDSLKLPKPITHEKGGSSGAFIDFNSDGIADFVYAYGDAKDWGAWTIEFDATGTPTGWVPAPVYKLPTSARLSDPDKGDLGVRFFDLNADARVDIVVGRREPDGSLVQHAFLNNGNGWENAPTSFLPPIPFVSRNRAEVHYETKVNQGDYYRDLRVNTSDLNGDGLSDLTFRYGHKPKVAGLGLAYDPGKAWCQNIDTIVPNPNPLLPSTVILHRIPSGTQCAGVFLATSTGWAPASDAYLPPVKLDISIEEENASIDVLDINGDGLVDLVPARLVNNTNAYSAYLNTGKSWAEHGAYRLPPAALSLNKKLTSHRIMDINGDGLVDLVYNRSDAEKGTFLNTGTGWGSANPDFAPPEPFVNEKGEDLGIRFIDVDGNGMPDALRSFRDKTGNLIQSAFLNSGDPAQRIQATESRADMLKTVSNGMGMTTTFTYRSLLSPRIGIEPSESDFYTPSPISAFPKISYVPTTYAVQEMSFLDTDGAEIATQYKYKGFRFDVPAAAVLGFEARTAWNLVDGVRSGVVERIEMFQDFARVGRHKKETMTINDVTVSETSNVFELFEPSGSSWPKRLVLTETKTLTRDLNGEEIGANSQFFSFDSFNNAVSTCIEYGDGSRTITKNTFDNSPDITAPDVLFLGRLLNTEVTSYRTTDPISCNQLLEGSVKVPSDQRVTNNASFRYDIRRDVSGRLVSSSTGVLVEEISNSDHPLALKKSYKHDNYGNIVSETVSTEGLPPRSKAIQFDQFGRFVVSESNALGHQIKYEFSDLLGVPTKITDANNVATQSEYDGFGRQIATITPTGLRISDSQEFMADERIMGRAVAFKQTRQQGQLPAITTYFDFQGRTLRTESLGNDDGTSRKIFEDVGYDARGRSTLISLPYFEGEEVIFGRTEYDNLDRAVKTTSPDGSTIQTTHSGLLTTVIDASGKSTQTRINPKGLTVEVVDNLGGSLQYEYGPGDRLQSTTQVDGLKIINEYDQVGNKVASFDPNLGRWDYRYNGFGEIVWQRDAKGQVTTVVYDDLGRPTERHAPDKLDEFHYDTKAFGIGKLGKLKTSDGYEEHFSYDTNGRVNEKATRIEDELYSTFIVYDDFDRPRQIYYPGNYIVTNRYDKFGYLAAVSANDPLKPFTSAPKVYWEAIKRDQYGRVLVEKLGNGTTTTHEYDPLVGSVGRRTVKGSDQTVLMDLQLDYDEVGNLLSKSHLSEKRTETFKYDGLDRLTDWNVNGEANGRYSYDAAGRILSKSGMGNYSYLGDGPAHGVKKITSPDGSVSNYEYDANGNMVFGPKGHFEYYANNYVRLIYKSDQYWSQFKYGPNGNRYFHQYSEKLATSEGQSVTSVRQTVSVGPYQHIRDLGGAFLVKPGGFKRHRLHLAAEGGVVAVLEHSTEFEPLAKDPEFRKQREGTPLATALSTTSASYLHKDELGSIQKISNSEGAVVSAYEYDPWGKKEQTAWLAKGKKDFASGTFRRGFTGHEHLDHLSLIHMNGRVYDPDLARFVSADPTLQFAGVTQNYDRYAYVGNNPLKFTDPSGFGWLSKAWKKLTRAIAKPFEAVGQWLEKNWRTVVVAVVAVAVTIASAGTLGPIAAGMLAGALASGLNVALYGGSLSDVMKAAFRGAVIGGISAGFAAGVGELGLGTYASAAAHGTTQGALTEIQGGDFWQGFAAAGFSSLVASYSEASAAYRQSSLTTKATIGALSGGAAAAIGGGKFENGAITGAFVVVFNHEAHKPLYEEEWYDFLADAPEIPQDVSDFVQGVGSGVSFGQTDKLNDYLGVGSFRNTDSAAFMYGEISGSLITSVYPASIARGLAYLGKLGQSYKYLRFINQNRYIRFGYTKVPDARFTYGSTYRTGVPGPTMRIGNGKPTWWNHWDLRVLGR